MIEDGDFIFGGSFLGEDGFFGAVDDEVAAGVVTAFHFDVIVEVFILFEDAAV